MARLWLIVVLVFLGCKSPENSCDRINGRLRAAVEFCRQITLKMATRNCEEVGSSESDEFAQCSDLYLKKGIGVCLQESGANQVAWAFEEFCR